MYMTLEIAFVLARLDVEFADEDDCKQMNANHVTPEDLDWILNAASVKKRDPRYPISSRIYSEQLNIFQG